VTTTANVSSDPTASEFRIRPASPWAGAWKIAAAVGIAGLLVAAYGFKTDPDRFAFSYLFGYFVTLSLALGNLFFVIVLYLTKASWGVSVRRIAEFFMRPMGVLVILILPLVGMLPHLFPWAGAKHGQGDPSAEVAGKSAEKTASPIAEARGYAEREPAAMRNLPVPDPKRLEQAEEKADAAIVNHKRFFLNPPFFFARLLFYMVVWSFLAWRYFEWSADQDTTRAVANTSAAQRFAPPALMLFAVTLTFFAFDWLLSLDATWYSTMFGVYIFSQCALFQIAALIITTLLLRRSGLLGEAVNVEHFHDMGKLLFGWIVFWSYIAFAQFFLTWYSNIPDEVAWFHKRWHDNEGSWQGVSLALVIFHFFVPFWFLMSRNMKRRLPFLAAGAAWMVFMHVVDMYWVIMPNYGTFSPSIVDLGCLVGVFGVYLAAVLRCMLAHSLIPVGDPRLTRSLEFENA
jgi:hypothetical protein